MDDIIVYKDESRIDILDNFLTLRQQKEKNVGKNYKYYKSIYKLFNLINFFVSNIDYLNS